MKLFGNPVPDEPVVTGVDLVRLALKGRNRSPHALGLIAAEIAVSASTLESFIAGGVLDDATLSKLTTTLLPHAKFDPVTRMLRKARENERTPLANPGYGKPFDVSTAPYRYVHKPGGTIGPQPLQPEKPQPKAPRPGWIE